MRMPIYHARTEATFTVTLPFAASFLLTVRPPPFFCSYLMRAAFLFAPDNTLKSFVKPLDGKHPDTWAVLERYSWCAPQAPWSLRWPCRCGGGWPARRAATLNPATQGTCACALPLSYWSAQPFLLEQGARGEHPTHKAESRDRQHLQEAAVDAHRASQCTRHTSDAVRGPARPGGRQGPACTTPLSPAALRGRMQLGK
jgi:hypothetical protein